MLVKGWLGLFDRAMARIIINDFVGSIEQAEDQYKTLEDGSRPVCGSEYEYHDGTMTTNSRNLASNNCGISAVFGVLLVALVICGPASPC